MEVEQLPVAPFVRSLEIIFRVAGVTVGYGSCAYRDCTFTWVESEGIEKDKVMSFR